MTFSKEQTAAECEQCWHPVTTRSSLPLPVLTDPDSNIRTMWPILNQRVKIVLFPWYHNILRSYFLYCKNTPTYLLNHVATLGIVLLKIIVYIQGQYRHIIEVLKLHAARTDHQGHLVSHTHGSRNIFISGLPAFPSSNLQV